MGKGSGSRRGQEIYYPPHIDPVDSARHARCIAWITSTASRLKQHRGTFESEIPAAPLEYGHVGLHSPTLPGGTV